MQLFLFALQIEIDAPADAFPAEGGPFLQQLPNAQHPGRAGDENIEIAAEAILQRRHAEKLLHQLFGIGAPLAVDGELEAAEVGLIPHIADLADLPELDEIHDLIHNGFHCGRGRNFGNFEAVVGFIVMIAAAYPHAAPAGGIDFIQLGFIVQQDAAAGEIGSDEGIGDIVLRVAYQRRRRFADLGQIEGADIAGHADGDTGIVIHQHRWEGHRQQRRLLYRAVVVIHKIDGIFIDIGEELGADLFQLDLGITGGGVGHVAGVRLAEVALAVHKGHQQRFVTARHAYHRLIDGRIAMGIQLHSFSHHTGRFCPRSG